MTTTGTSGPREKEPGSASRKNSRFPFFSRVGRALRRQWKKNRGRIAITVLIFIFFTLYFWRNIFIRVDVGEAGVRWNRLSGTVTDEVYLEGTILIPPWDKMYIYDVRVQERTDSLILLSVNGLAISVRSSTRFRPVIAQLPQLHQTYGPEYETKVVKPEVVTALRRVFGNYTPEEIYAKDEFALLDEVKSLVQREVDQRYLQIEEVLIQSLRLPPDLENAILNKLVQEQKFLEYEFRLSRERLEADRKAIEGQGIADFERLSGIPILQWRGLEVTEALANSPNSKIILVPTGSGQLPIILNTGGDLNSSGGNVGPGGTPGPGGVPGPDGSSDAGGTPDPEGK